MFTGHQMRRRFFFGCYLSLPLFATGFHCSRLGSVSALRRTSSVAMDNPGGKIPRSGSRRDSLAADLAEGAEDLFAQTPLIRSGPLSALVGKAVYLKLDALQASGSFKVSRVCETHNGSFVLFVAFFRESWRNTRLQTRCSATSHPVVCGWVAAAVSLSLSLSLS